MLPAPAARLLFTLAVAAGLLLVGAGPAAAHVAATIQAGARAGEGPVTVAFSAEAESPTAGIASIRTQLPAGVPPESVSLASGPAGWVLTPTAAGYDVIGTPLPPGTAAEFTVTIERLPADATVLTFKTLVRYVDGNEDAWIEEPTADNPEPQNPAPVITVAPAASPSPATSSVAPTTTTPQPTSPATPSTTPQAQTGGGDSTPVWPFAVGALAVVAVAGGLGFRRLQQRPRE